MKKRLLALIMVLSLALSLVPVGAAAPTDAGPADSGATGSAQQIENEGGTTYYKADGTKAESGTLGENGVVVEMSKTIEGTNTENEFDVTLQVKTNQKVTEISTESPDAAVVLVLDVSNSMDDCVNCGKEKDKHKKGWCGDGQGTMYSSRLAAAQEAAKDFIQSFAQETGEGARYVSIVAFGSDAERQRNWIDVSQEGGVTTAQNAVDDVRIANGNTSEHYDRGGTNIEAGLMLAKNLLTSGLNEGGAIHDTDYLYTVLLTDGEPTYHVEGNSTSTEKILGKSGGNSYATPADVKGANEQANAIRGIEGVASSDLFSICFGEGVFSDCLIDDDEYDQHDMKEWGGRMSPGTLPLESGWKAFLTQLWMAETISTRF